MAWAIQYLGDLAEGVLSGDVLAFNLTSQSASDGVQRATYVKEPQDFDIHALSVATMVHGKSLLKQMSTREGNAPRMNRSTQEQ